MYGSTDTYTPAAGQEDLDFLIDKLRKEDDEDIRQRCHRMAYEAVTHQVRVQYERDSSLNYRYIENDCYTDEELAEFAERGQPPTRRNELAPIMERIAGQFIQTRQSVTFLGRNTPADDQSGALTQDYQRWNDQQNMFEFEEQDVTWDGLVGGVGWYKATIKRNELGENCETWRARNPYDIFKDPFSRRYNPNDDAKYIIDAPWMDLEDAIGLWPDKEKELRSYLSSPSPYGPFEYGNVAPSLRNEAMSAAVYQDGFYVDRLRHRVRPFEIWYKRKVRIYHLFRPDKVVAIPVPLDHKTARDIISQVGEGLYAVPSWQDRMYVGVILGHLLIHHDLSPHETNLFPFVPFYTGIRKNGGPLALANRLVPIVDAINKRESKALSLLTNNKVYFEEDAIDDEEEFAAENAKPDGMPRLKDGALSQKKVLIEKNLEMGQAQMGLLQEDKDAVRRVSGHGNESMGMPSEVRSGSGIARKQMMSNLIVTPMQNNLRRTRYMKAQLSFALQKQYLTEEMAFQLTDDPNVPRLVTLNKGYLKAIREYRYDAVITEMKDYAVLREQQAEILLQHLPQLAQHGTWMIKLGIQLTELRDKENLIKLVDQQSQPAPIMPKINLSMDWKELTPEVQAYLMYRAMQSKELAEAILQKGDDPAFMQKIEAELTQTLIKEGTRATVERGNLDLSALQTAVEGRMRLREILDQSPSTQPTGASASTGEEGDL